MAKKGYNWASCLSCLIKEKYCNNMVDGGKKICYGVVKGTKVERVTIRFYSDEIVKEQKKYDRLKEV